MASVSPSAELQVAYPPRFRWLRRIVLGCVLLALSLAGLRGWWGWEAERRLRRALDAIAAAGRPVRAADLADPPVPAETNAATWFKKAAAAIDPNTDAPTSTSLEYSSYPPYPPQWHVLADKSVAANSKAFGLAREARRFDRFDWAPAPKSLDDPVLKDLNDARHLANTLGDAALHQHLRGDGAAALETIRDARHLARSVASEPLVVAYLVANGLESIIGMRLQIIATGLRVAPGGAAPGDSAGVSREQVRAVITELLDDDWSAESVRRALAGERALQIDAGLRVAGTTRLLRPMVTLDLLRVLEAGDAYLAGAAQPTWPAAAKAMGSVGAGAPVPRAVNFIAGSAPPPPTGRRQPFDYARLLTLSDLNASNYRLVVHEMRAKAMRRMTAVSLAAQVYRADHGRCPPDLAALVPKYLDRIPADPFAADGGPLRYFVAKGGLPDGGDRPLVYSVSENGVDETPDARVLPTEPHFGWHRWRDEYLDLVRWAPPAAPTTGPTTAPAAPGG